MIEAMIVYATLLVGTPYQWGGNMPEEGIDCSGFVLHVLREQGLEFEDMTAQGLYYELRNRGWRSGLSRGSILFFGDTINNISHVGIYIGSGRMISSTGGDRGTNIDESIEKGFGVKITDVRDDLVGAIKPRL